MIRLENRIPVRQVHAEACRQRYNYKPYYNCYIMYYILEASSPTLLAFELCQMLAVAEQIQWSHSEPGALSCCAAFTTWQVQKRCKRYSKGQSCTEMQMCGQSHIICYNHIFTPQTHMHRYAHQSKCKSVFKQYFLSPASQVKHQAIHFPLSGSGITALAKPLQLSSFHIDYKRTHATHLKEQRRGRKTGSISSLAGVELMI